MAKQYPQFSFSGGIESSNLPYRGSRDGFYSLLNFRPSRQLSGQIEQTDPAYNHQFSQATYWDGAASATEPSSSKFNIYSNDIITTDYSVRDSSGQIKVFDQTTVPASETINTCCLLVINSVSGLNISLGSTLDVVIDGATTFKWRKNGGAYTTLVPIVVGGVSIDGGNATVYFLTASGFTVNDTWSWTRTDRNYTTFANIWATVGRDYVYNKSYCYYFSQDKRMMVVKYDGTVNYAISVGYRPVFGSYVTFFDDHLVIGGFSKTAIPYNNGPITALANRTVGWSDKSDYDNFFSTDTNEADSYAFPNATKNDYTAVTGSTNSIRGCVVIGAQLFVFLLDAFYATSALGLPLVFSFSEVAKIALTSGFRSVIPVPFGAYLSVSNDLLFFDGSSFKSFGKPLLGTVSTIAVDLAEYNRDANELYIIMVSKMYVLMVDSGKWFQRAISYNSDTYPVRCFHVYNYDSIYFGTKDLIRVTTMSGSGSDTPVKDWNSGTEYVVPKITFNSLGQNLRTVKEISGVFLSARVSSLNSSKFSTDANCQFKIYWYNSDTGEITGSPTTDANAVWVNTQTDGMISSPHLNFRSLALEIQLNGLVANKPPGKAIITGFEPITLEDGQSVEK